MPNYLLLDSDDKAINYITADPGAVRIVEYTGPFVVGGQFDGETVISPPPDEPPAPSDD